MKGAVHDLFENFEDGVATITSKSGWKWTDVIHDIGMRYSDWAHQDFVIRAERVADIRGALQQSMDNNAAERAQRVAAAGAVAGYDFGALRRRQPDRLHLPDRHPDRHRPKLSSASWPTASVP